MVKIGGSKKRKLSLEKERKLNETRGNIYKFCGNIGEFINFWEIGGICNTPVCIIGLGG